MKYKYIILLLSIFLFCIIFVNRYNKEYFIDKQSFNKIYIFQGEETSGTYAGKVEFMYKPIVNSIIKLLNNTYPSIPIIFKINDFNFNELNENDVFIWIGDNKTDTVDYNDLRNRNIHSIYYNSEPDIRIVNSDEIWTYSKYLYNVYEKHGDQIIKFIPVCDDDSKTFISYKNINPKDLKLYFMGSFNFRRDKYDIIMQNIFMKDKIVEIYNVWNEEDYINLIKQDNPPKIFLNLTKSGLINALPSVRINKLLSNKCIVISEHTNPIDEELYNGIVYFADIDKIADLFIELTNKTSDELEMESETRYQKFKEKFNYKNAENLISVK
jgi:hypothetical protein